MKGFQRRPAAEPLAPSAPKFSAEDFAAPDRECDIIMKGGVTSGVVYPYAILQLARSYRFRSVGGASAGGIAAAFAAAAEFARSRGDPGGFVRLEKRCLELPARLRSLFQAEPRFQPLMDAALAASAKDGAGVRRALWAGPLPLLAGFVAGAGLLWGLHGGWAGAGLGGLVGAGAVPAMRIVYLARLLFKHLPAHDFGMCRGLSVDGKVPALTDWLYDALQDIAFGDTAPGHRPLTFGDLRKAAPEGAPGHGVALKMMTTNLSMRRPHALPELMRETLFEAARWAKIFPAPVMAYLTRPNIGRVSKHWPDHRLAPSPDNLPVIVAVRMSLSFPFLITAVPMAIRDIGAQKRAIARGVPKDEAAPKAPAPLWFSDGGLTSNFPIHFFDALLPARPTFALSLDAIPEDEPTDGPRVRLQMEAGEGIFLPISPVQGLGGFAMALFNASKDWQDTLLSGMPGQRERIIRVALAEDEGGLNLDMPPQRSETLMAYGDQAGQMLSTQFDFDEHRWRRTLTAYEQLEWVGLATDQVWGQGFGAWYKAYASAPKSYKSSTKAERRLIADRLAAFGKLGRTFTPALRERRIWPRPSGRIRVAPDV